MPGETQGQSHQISNLTIGPDGKLYVHNGDGFDAGHGAGPELLPRQGPADEPRRRAAADNPFYDAADGNHRPRLHLRLRLPQPLRRRLAAADGAHYEVENGPRRRPAGRGHRGPATTAGTATPACSTAPSTTGAVRRAGEHRVRPARRRSAAAASRRQAGPRVRDRVRADLRHRPAGGRQADRPRQPTRGECVADSIYTATTTAATATESSIAVTTLSRPEIAAGPRR